MASATLPHEAAVSVFVERVTAADIVGLSRLVLFGSVADGTHRPDSDVDVLAVVEDDTATSVVEDRLRALAYDVMLEQGAAFSIHGVSESQLDARSTHPFFKHVLDEGETIYE